jgi:hypothetical protein
MVRLTRLVLRHRWHVVGAAVHARFGSPALALLAGPRLESVRVHPTGVEPSPLRESGERGSPRPEQALGPG